MSARTRNQLVGEVGRVKLNNRRVMVGMKRNGGILLQWKRLADCDDDGKYVQTTRVTLSQEAAGATAALLLEMLGKIESGEYSTSIDTTTGEGK